MDFPEVALAMITTFINDGVFNNVNLPNDGTLYAWRKAQSRRLLFVDSEQKMGGKGTNYLMSWLLNHQS
jgi:hypothetical protein